MAGVRIYSLLAGEPSLTSSTTMTGDLRAH